MPHYICIVEHLCNHVKLQITVTCAEYQPTTHTVTQQKTASLHPQRKQPLRANYATTFITTTDVLASWVGNVFRAVCPSFVPFKRCVAGYRYYPRVQFRHGAFHISNYPHPHTTPTPAPQVLS